MKTAATIAGCVLVIVTTAAFAASPPGVINYQGVLRDETDKPVENGSYAMDFRFFDVESGGEAILVDSQDDIAVSGGLFNATLGLESNISDGTGPGTYTSLEQVFGDFSQLYLEVEVNSETLAPRMPLASSGFSLNSRLVRGVEITTDGPLNLYVDDDGDDANSGLAPETPKQTIQATIDAIPPVLTGDVTIFIASGTYNERLVIFPRVRTGLHWIRLLGSEAFPQTVILDGAGLPPDEDGPGSGIFVYDLPIEIAGVTVQNYGDRAISAEFDTYLQIRNCRVVNNLTPDEAAVAAGQGAEIELYKTVVANNCVGVGASHSGRVTVRSFVDISDNGADPTCGPVENANIGVEARSGGSVSFDVDNDGDCTLSNNDMHVNEHSTISRWDHCTLVNSTCVEDTGDPTAICRPDPGP